MKLNHTYRSGALLLLGTALSACSFLDTDPQVIPAEGYYTSETKLQYGLAGVYGALNSEELYGNYYSLQISNADDLCYFNNYNNGETRPDRYNHTAGTAVIYDTWLKLYQGIKNANEYIRGVEASAIDPEELSTPKGQYLAEAKFLRAYYHFLLAQAWGDVPLRTTAADSPNPNDVQLPATPQEKVLKWCVDEIEAIVGDLDPEVDQTPSRVSRTVAEGMLARIYLFMAGNSVAEVDGLPKQEMYKKAAEWAYKVIESGKHHLNPSYEQVFINMIQDKYDTEYHESMWEAEFLGDRTSADKWTNGRIGDLIGLKSQSSNTNYSEWACNYSYGFYNGTYTLWQLYSETDRVESDLSQADDEDNIAGKMVIDKRRLWNLPGYNFQGYSGSHPTGGREISYKINGTDRKGILLQTRSMYRTPWNYNNIFAMRTVEGLQEVEGKFDMNDLVYEPDVMCAVRNAGKWRRETIYEQQMSAKSLYTTINFPLLRYSDVLLMYAEAINEYAGAPDELAREAVRQIRNRAGIRTDENQLGNQQTFRELVRNERGRELVFEGLRKYDLIRWGIFVERMHQAGTNLPTENKYRNATYTNYAAMTYANVGTRHIYLPIPTKELAVNHALTQNPLW